MLPPLRMRLRLWCSPRTTASAAWYRLCSERLGLRLRLARVYASILRIWSRLLHQVLCFGSRLLVWRLSRLLFILLLLLLSTSFGSLLIPRIILPFLTWWSFFVTVLWSLTLWLRALIPRVVVVLILRRRRSSSLSHILLIPIVILLVVAAIPRLLVIILVLFLVLIPITILRRRLSLYLTIIGPPRRLVLGVGIVRHSVLVVVRHVPLFEDRSSAHCQASVLERQLQHSALLSRSNANREA